MDLRIVLLFALCGALLLAGCASTPSSVPSAPAYVPSSASSAVPSTAQNAPGSAPSTANAGPADYANQKCTRVQANSGSTDYYFRDLSHFKLVGTKKNGSLSYTMWVDGKSSYTQSAGSSYGSMVVANSDAEAATGVQNILTQTKQTGSTFSCVPYVVTDADLARPPDSVFGSSP